jgi:anthranilate 1,2-dioxygenase large subunit/terephthalate 1,2-dioxygenase oxygenase component alpha subunit
MEPNDGRRWEANVLTRVPNWIYQDPEIYAVEQQRIFQGPVWTFLCLAIELPRPGDFRTASLGDMPVIVARDDDGEIYAFENRCVHRGALLSFDDGGHVDDFTCVYHNWRYDRRGNLKGIAFRNGVKGKGGMPKDFCQEDHRPRSIRVACLNGLVFGTLRDDAPSLEQFLGPEIVQRISRVLCKPIEIIGRFKQTMPNNWKLFLENTRDSYHASLLHVFFTTFRLNRLSQRGGVIISETGAHAVNFSVIDKQTSSTAEYDAEKLRSDVKDFTLADPSLLDGYDEFGDGITLQIVSVFPGFALGQVRHSLAVRRIVPKGLDKTELHWTYLGYTDDTPELRKFRLKQCNLIGPAGFVAMEDGIIGNFVQRGIMGAADEAAIVEMGGDAIGSDDSRATEAAIRGLWKAYRSYTGI